MPPALGKKHPVSPKGVHVHAIGSKEENRVDGRGVGDFSLALILPGYRIVEEESERLGTVRQREGKINRKAGRRGGGKEEAGRIWNRPGEWIGLKGRRRGEGLMPSSHAIAVQIQTGPFSCSDIHRVGPASSP